MDAADAAARVVVAAGTDPLLHGTFNHEIQRPGILPGRFSCLPQAAEDAFRREGRYSFRMNSKSESHIDQPNDGFSVDSDRMSRMVDDIAASISGDARTSHVSSAAGPDADAVAEINQRLRWLAFPGFFGPRELNSDTLSSHVEGLITDLGRRLCQQVGIALYGEQVQQASEQADAGEVVSAFMERVVEVRRMLSLDVQAAFDGDPAARHLDEVILCNPGLRSITVHRFAHELHLLGVPLLPRMMAEQAHSETGIDLHPGACIGEAFFIDHGTGVVVGETTVVGARCKLYQGVTLGAASFDREPDGTLRRGYRRHPTLEDDVTVYAGATILGGDTVIGRGSIVNGGVFLTRSVPADSIVKGPKLEVRLRNLEDS